MDGLTLLKEASAAGLRVRVEGDKLVINGPRQAEPIARKLIDHKLDVLSALRRPTAETPPAAPTGDDTADWRELFEERAAMRQYCGGYRRDVAETLAFCEAVETWCDVHPLPHRLDTCAGCGEPLSFEVLDLCDDARVHWERHQEFTCLIAYGEKRRRRAVEALAAIGLYPPAGLDR